MRWADVDRPACPATDRVVDASSLRGQVQRVRAVYDLIAKATVQ